MLDKMAAIYPAEAQLIWNVLSETGDWYLCWPHISADISVNLNIPQEENFSYISTRKKTNNDRKLTILMIHFRKSLWCGRAFKFYLIKAFWSNQPMKAIRNLPWIIFAVSRNNVKTTEKRVAPWCSVYHYCTTSFNKAWTEVQRRFKSCSRHDGDLRRWRSLTMVSAGNKAIRLLSVNHTTKTIHHHRCHHQMFSRKLHARSASTLDLVRKCDWCCKC